ncbi:conserved hypothetical protein [Rhizobium sp. EC-SD404]|nr:conserved hypothetical protein [Rhizobium sp. EC-SD404]
MGQEEMPVGAVLENGNHEEAPSEIFCQCLEVVDELAVRSRLAVARRSQAMIEMIVNEGPLGLLNGLLHGVHLLRDVEARTLRLDHRNDALEMSFSALEALDDVGMRGMKVGMSHCKKLSPRGG